MQTFGTATVIGKYSINISFYYHLGWGQSRTQVYSEREQVGWGWSKNGAASLRARPATCQGANTGVYWTPNHEDFVIKSPSPQIQHLEPSTTHSLFSRLLWMQTMAWPMSTRT